MESDDNQAQIRGTDMNELTVRGGILSYKSVIVKYKYNFDCYNIISLFSNPFLMEDFLHYMASFGPF